MGRQPTSGYCQTCRKRRVKCGENPPHRDTDKARPHCGRCLASGHPCGGYDLPLRVQVLGVHSEHDGTQRLVRVPTQQQSNPGRHLAHELLPSTENDMRLGLRDSQHWQQQTSAAYFFATFNWAPFWRPLILSATDGDSLDINRVCFQAISYGYMGLSLGDRALQARGGRLYGQVLREVQALLLQQEKSRLAKLGFTMVMMNMYEALGPAPPHHVGIIRILQHCGPGTFQEESLLEAFRSCRALLALCRQSRCLLEDEPWKTLPWQQRPKTFEDRLMDIIVDLPGVAESVVAPHKRAACLDKINTLTVALQEWRWDWHAVHAASVRQVRHHAGGSLVEEMPDTRAPPPTIVNQMLLASLEFDSPRLALDILYYNATLLYLMQLEAVARGQPSPPEPEILSREDERYIRRQAARNNSDGGGNPLLLPGQVKFHCQAAAEAFMTLSCVTRLLATTPEKATVVPPAAIGVVYCVLRDQLRLGDGWLALLLSKHALFHDAQRVFWGYFVGVRR
ncbi:hypothetical protein C8A01DRAFT_18811 [Parachaetomium inaequale]|uniref:Zn(2)-C6 fungal-type domain-containing protein n=1 Tax=Parachaetomium inaequale TaxID=2588326 RepID=A0AAN6SNP9_9PEZI|nr:hypothetical protein C8A01DRAFT_18811 [Parachaetomium inaequale]